MLLKRWRESILFVMRSTFIEFFGFFAGTAEKCWFSVAFDSKASTWKCIKIEIMRVFYVSSFFASSYTHTPTVGGSDHQSNSKWDINRCDSKIENHTFIHLFHFILVLWMLYVDWSCVYKCFIFLPVLLYTLPPIDFFIKSIQIQNVVLLLMIIKHTYRFAIVIFTQVSYDEFYCCLFSMYECTQYHTRIRIRIRLAFYMKSFRA